MIEPTDTRARAIAAHRLINYKACTASLPTGCVSCNIIDAALRAERQAVWEEAAKVVENESRWADLLFAPDIVARLRQRAADE